MNNTVKTALLAAVIIVAAAIAVQLVVTGNTASDSISAIEPAAGEPANVEAYDEVVPSEEYIGEEIESYSEEATTEDEEVLEPVEAAEEADEPVSDEVME